MVDAVTMATLDASGNLAATGTLGNASGKFNSDASGNITKINNVTTSFPSAQGTAGSHLRNDGSGNLAWSPTLPAFRACGADAGGTGTVAPGLPAGHVTNDILVLFIQSANEAGTCPATYTQVGPQPGTGTAAAAAATRLTVCWHRDGGAESGPTVADTGNHTYAVICAFSGAAQTGDPFHFISSGVKATASTSTSITGGATTVDAALVVNAVAQGVSGTAGIYSAEANTSLGSVTERWDAGTTSGVGGGLAVIVGSMATAGTVAATTATVTSTAEAFSTLALLPNDTTQPGKTPRACDVQSFTACGVTSGNCPSDTWVKPTGAKTVEIIAIGGGGAGGAGRSAATAAGGGGGGGGAYQRAIFQADQLQATMTVAVGRGGIGGATANAGTASTVTDNSLTLVSAGFGVIGVAAISADGGDGGAGGSVGTGLVAAAGGTCTGSSTVCMGIGGQGAGQGTGTTTTVPGGNADAGGGGGACGTTGATAGGAGGKSNFGGGGGGGGTVSGTGGTGGVGGQGHAGGAAHASAVSSGIMTMGGSGGGGGDATTTGGNGAQPGGGGGGGGNATASGGNGGDGAVTIISCF